jgi:CheY-like chemotaxis protein
VVNLKPLIAILENDPTMCRALVRLLTARGFATQTFASAEAYIERKTGDPIACLLLDIGLDGISGIELRLTDSGSGIPVIFITAIDDEATCQKAIAAGGIGLAQTVSGGSTDRRDQLRAEYESERRSDGTPFDRERNLRVHSRKQWITSTTRRFSHDRRR